MNINKIITYFNMKYQNSWYIKDRIAAQDKISRILGGF